MELRLRLRIQESYVTIPSLSNTPSGVMAVDLGRCLGENCRIIYNEARDAVALGRISWWGALLWVKALLLIGYENHKKIELPDWVWLKGVILVSGVVCQLWN